jgi:two-component system alkaline phosphatase synthesis response regulator PhoP
VLRRHEEAPENGAIPFGPWQVHPKRMVAERAGSEIELTLREVKLIVLLAKRCGEVVSRDELLNECWGLEYFPESRTLDQHVLNLRKKIELDPSRPTLIETVRGAGYRFPGSLIPDPDRPRSP